MMMSNFDVELIDGEYDLLESPEDDNLTAVCWHIVEWWMEDYTFEELLEEFDVEPEEAFLAVVRAGLIDPEDLEAYLTSDL